MGPEMEKIRGMCYNNLIITLKMWREPKPTVKGGEWNGPDHYYIE